MTFAAGPEKALVCPNKTILEQFFGYYFKYLSGLGQAVNFEADAMEAVSRAAASGHIAPFLTYVENALQTEAGLHSRLQLSEASIQFFMLGAARLLTGFKATAEEEALGVGVTDVMIRPMAESDFRQSYLVELKYLTQEAGTPTAVEQKLNDACRQLAAYASAENLRTLPNLKKVAVVFVGSTVKGVRYL